LPLKKQGEEISRKDALERRKEKEEKELLPRKGSVLFKIQIRDEGVSNIEITEEKRLIEAGIIQAFKVGSGKADRGQANNQSAWRCKSQEGHWGHRSG